MKTLAVLLLAGVSLGGCAVVPYEPAPVVYAAPPPVVVVRPAPIYGYGGYYGGYYRGYYGGGYGYYRGGPYWHRRWR